MPKLQLYNYFRSSTSYRVRIALHLKGLDFEYHPVHLLNDGGEQHKAEYRKINPIGEVPTLVVDGVNIAQSLPIIEFLDERFSQTPLFPKDLLSKAKVRQICENINCGMHPLQNLKVIKFLESQFQVTEVQKTQWLNEWMGQGFSAIEQILTKTAGTFAMGDVVTAADLFIVPQIFSAERFKIDLSSYKTIMRVNETCLRLPAFLKAHPFRQIDTPSELRIS